MFEPDDIMPIKIRDDLIVRIAQIPHDLTKEEAERISRVVLALANKDQNNNRAEQ